MEYVEDITCYPVCASASGAIAELIENSYVPPDWLILLQVVLKRISTGDENESALLSKLLGTIVEGGQEKVLSHIPEIVSNIASTVMELLSPVPDPWPQKCMFPQSCLDDHLSSYPSIPGVSNSLIEVLRAILLLLLVAAAMIAPSGS